MQWQFDKAENVAAIPNKWGQVISIVREAASHP